MSSKAREFWISKGSSCFADELRYDWETDKNEKCSPDDFYDLVSPKDTIKGGIHVVEAKAYTDLKAKADKLEEFIKEVAASPFVDSDIKSLHHTLMRRARVLLKDYRGE